jgi:hypothetical protein
MPIEKIKILGPFWSYQLDSSDNPAHYLKNGPNGLNWQCCLAVSSKTAPRILIFLIGMVADYSFDVKNINIKHNNLIIAIAAKPSV